MPEPADLEHNRHWRMAVWALRAGYLSLIVAVAGIILLVSGSTPWVLAVGVIAWLACAAVTVTGALWSRREQSEPRPGLWAIRFMLIRDTVHAQPSAEGS
jgi:hypothetical protein